MDLTPTCRHKVPLTLKGVGKYPSSPLGRIKDIFFGYKGAFRLGVRYSSVESPYTTYASHLGVKPAYHEDFMLS